MPLAFTQEDFLVFIKIYQEFVKLYGKYLNWLEYQSLIDTIPNIRRRMALLTIINQELNC